ncbi:MAG: hypothetical protein WBN88_21375 [Anderseniella sp.]
MPFFQIIKVLYKFNTKTMKNLALFKVIIILFSSMLMISCNSDDDDDMGNYEPVAPEDPTTGVNITYTLNSVAVESISGIAKFIENKDNSVTIELELSNTPAGGQHPAHIHYNTAAEGGGIALTLGIVDGTTGKSAITVSALDDGTVINYDDLIAFNGYINVHLSADELGTIVGQGDIGTNALTGVSKSYDLMEKAVPGIEGKVTFYERLNGQALSVIELTNTPENGIHPAHIHNNTAVEGGGIAFSFNPVDGTSGMSKTNIKQLDDGTAFGYNDLLDFDGYINVHLSADELGTIVAQGDIGQNELTSVSKSYTLNENAVPGISGMVTFYKRLNGEALSKIEIMNTPANGVHPAHIHVNSVVEGGDIAIILNSVDGNNGMSYTNISQLDNGTPFGYDDVIDFDGYINIHLSEEDLATVVAQGDIGQNELTGESLVYTLAEKDVPGISGEVTFFERVSGESLALISLINTPAGGVHPAHIHDNDAATGGGIAFSFNPVNGDSGMSYTHVGQLDDGTSFTYNDIDTFMGYINVHLSADQLSTIVAQGNIGASIDDDSSASVVFEVTNSGASAYIFNGGDLSNESNPDLTLKRGMTYEFDMNTPSHPFYIKTAQATGTGNTYTDGIGRNGSVDGKITFTVPMDAPDTLYYICEFHASMTGTFTIID